MQIYNVWFQSNVTCEKIDLSANWIEGDGGRYMARVFMENDYINEVVRANACIRGLLIKFSTKINQSMR